MKNVESSTINKLKATHQHDELVQYGKQLHSAAVFMGILKIIMLFRNNTRKTIQFDEKQGTLKYSR